MFNTYSSYDPNSFVEYNECLPYHVAFGTRLYPYNGHVICSGFLKGFDEKTIDLRQNTTLLLANIEGVSDVITLYCEHLNSTETRIYSSISCEEFH
jgi:hypothetical protein